ncbi:MAG: hypothetical protein IKY98_02230 [Alphaproteobacteria bacterium]|nr:hypothetical protein [Alphaproteobacteria bacterium]
MSKLLDLKTGFFATTNEDGVLDYYYVPDGDWDNVKSLGSGKDHKCFSGLYGHRFLLFKTCPKGSQEQHICLYNNYGECLFSGPVESIMLDAKSDIFVIQKNGKMETKSLGCGEHRFDEVQRRTKGFENRQDNSKKLCAQIAAMVIGCVAVCGALKCISDNVEAEEKDLQSTEATYVGTADGYALFDLDGNKQTIEAVGKMTPETEDKLVGKIGMVAKISEWAEQAKLTQMERVVTRKSR